MTFRMTRAQAGLWSSRKRAASAFASTGARMAELDRDRQPKRPEPKRYWLLAPSWRSLPWLFHDLATFGNRDGGHRGVLREVEPFRTVMEWIDPTPANTLLTGW